MAGAGWPAFDLLRLPKHRAIRLVAHEILDDESATNYGAISLEAVQVLRVGPLTCLRRLRRKSARMLVNRSIATSFSFFSPAAWADSTSPGIALESRSTSAGGANKPSRPISSSRRTHPISGDSAKAHSTASQRFPFNSSSTASDFLEELAGNEWWRHRPVLRFLINANGQFRPAFHAELGLLFFYLIRR